MGSPGNKIEHKRWEGLGRGVWCRVVQLDLARDPDRVVQPLRIQFMEPDLGGFEPGSQK